MPSSVVLLQSDSRIAQSLVASLPHSFHRVQAVRSVDELRANIAKHRAEVVILDMEVASILDVERLSHEFPGVGIVCTHRLADEEMWTAALNAGAADICLSYDTLGILTAAVRSALLTHPAAA
jgi:DNA-binding NarL/FixJ family response regulator